MNDTTRVADTTIGLDIAKNVFHLVVINGRGQVIERKRLRRSQVMRYFANLPSSCIALEACASGHYWARTLLPLGHSIKLLPPQHVKGYLRGQKNDTNDAQAIAEACHHGAVRGVAVKSPEQQAQQAVHRVRARLIKERTALCNQLRGLLGEYGVTMACGIASVRRALPETLNDDTHEIPQIVRTMAWRQYQRLLHLDEEIAWYQEQIKEQVKHDTTLTHLVHLPGFGPIVASGFKSWLGDGRQFNRGREAAAALGVVPRQHSTGGKPLLLGISKRGDPYIRCLVIHGARSVVRCAHNKSDPLSLWIQRLVQRRGIHKATVALANKLVRMAWAIVAYEQDYRPAVHHGITGSA